MSFKVILKNLNHPEQVIVLHECATGTIAQEYRKAWRRNLGNRWTVDRRPGLDTLDFLALTVIREGRE